MGKRQHRRKNRRKVKRARKQQRVKQQRSKLTVIERIKRDIEIKTGKKISEINNEQNKT